MFKQKVKNIAFYKLARIPLLVIVLVLVLGTVALPQVRADQFDEQIKALSADNDSKQANRAQLGAEATSLTDTINKLQAQISAMQAQIDANKAKVADLQNQIAQAEADLAKQKQVLGENIKQMYLEGDISTLEMLASSNDLSDFVDKQQYRNSVQDKIKTTLDKINELKNQLKEQKTQVEQALKDQQAIQDQLNGQQAEQDQLLSANVDQQNSLNAAIKQNSSQISALRRQQIIANARFSGGAPGSGPACGGGYPAKWCEIPQDSVIDNWGMYNRECVSYTAFKVAASGRHMPYWGGVGNANQWDENARAADILVDGNPREGDVAQTNNGPYGHVMYVEFVYGDGTILISQYNANLDGRYSEKRISASGLNYIHF